MAILHEESDVNFLRLKKFFFHQIPICIKEWIPILTDFATLGKMGKIK
jgi:hypothetical protein